MKINRLYTLSQIIDKLESGEIDNGCADSDMCFIIEYNNFLKQSLTKEMFVNIFGEMPQQEDFIGDSLAYSEQIEQWIEVQNKVIFPGWKLNYQSEYMTEFVKNIGSLEYKINFARIRHTFIWDDNISENVVIKNLDDLSRISEGQLETINLEI